jgi:hypothetical protein
MNAKCAKRFMGIFVGLSFLVCDFLLPMPFAQAVPSDQRHGLVSGAVLDDVSIPIEGATIIATKSSGIEEARTITDSGGHYSLKVEYGDFTIVGVKEKDAFPDCRLNLFSCFLPMYQVNEKIPSVIANLKLNRAARIEGRVVDRADGKEIGSSTLLIRRADDFYKGYQVTIDSSFSILVPQNVELTLSIWKLKYRLWNYRDPKTNYATLRVGSGTATEIPVSMDRVEP